MSRALFHGSWCKLPQSSVSVKLKTRKRFTILNGRKNENLLITETKIVTMLKQHEQGVKVFDIVSSNGITEKIFNRWKS